MSSSDHRVLGGVEEARSATASSGGWLAARTVARHERAYRRAIAEAARVASRYCIFHTVPVFDDYRTTFLRKYAYGAPVIEIIFGKPELMSLCQDFGLRLEREWACIPYDMHEVTGHHSRTETYLFSKSAKP